MTSSSGEKSFVQNEDDDDEWDVSNNGDQESDVDIGEENIQDSEDATTIDTAGSQETNTQRIVVAPHKKWQQVRSIKQVLSEVANNLKIMAETSLKYFKIMGEEDKRREQGYMPFRGEEAEKNRYHELCISEIFARAAQPTFPPSLDFSHFLNGHTFTLKVSYIPNQTTKPISPDNHDPYQPYF